jgi:hypothetical protein
LAPCKVERASNGLSASSPPLSSLTHYRNVNRKYKSPVAGMSFVCKRHNTAPSKHGEERTRVKGTENEARDIMESYYMGH